MKNGSRKICRVCRISFDPGDQSSDPAEELGRFLAREQFGDADQLCRACLANRGRLGMMYLRERD